MLHVGTAYRVAFYFVGENDRQQVRPLPPHHLIDLNHTITHLLVERMGEGGYQAPMDGNATPSPRRVEVEHGLSGRRLAPDEVLEPVIDEEYQLLRRLTDYREPYRYARTDRQRTW
jgi:hypothetical protein